jgi:hypothetical protein
MIQNHVFNTTYMLLDCNIKTKKKTNMILFFN